MSEHSILPEDEVRRRLQAIEDDEQRILEPAKGFGMSWQAHKPHEGPPLFAPGDGLRLFREKRSAALTRTVMTDEQRAEFVGDAKPS